MGKYMRKTKSLGEVTVMELGVLTRAKTRALRRLRQSPSPSPFPVASGSFLQLRSRRLPKPLSVVSGNESKRQQTRNPSPRKGSVSIGCVSDGGDQKFGEILAGGSENEDFDLVIEGDLFGENVLEFEFRERSTRESTSSPGIIRTPSSTTRPTTSVIETNHRNHYSANRHMPTAHEMDEFFALAEEKQQRYFTEKYNFDPVKDTPLPGRYEWEKLQP